MIPNGGNGEVELDVLQCIPKPLMQCPAKMVKHMAEFPARLLIIRIIGTQGSGRFQIPERLY